MTPNYAETFAPLVAAGFPCPTPGEAFVVTGDHTLGLLQGAARDLPEPWVLLAMHDESTDEPPTEMPHWKGPRQWRCVLIDNIEAMQPTA